MGEIASVSEMAAAPIEILEGAVSRQSQNSLPLLDPIWVSKIKQKHYIEPRKLKASSARKSCSIHRVPFSLRQHNKKVYEPQIISIGPFHYKKRRHQLRAMEEHKWRYLHDILSRNGEGSLERYLAKVKEHEERARECYSEVIYLDSNSFVEMMVLDSCFIIELFRKALGGHEEYGEDPIFNLGWLRSALKADLIILENQIPFFILEYLSNLIDPKDDSPRSSPLVAGALRFLYPYWNFTREDYRNLTKERNSRHSSTLVERAFHFFGTFFKEIRVTTTEERIKDRGIKIQPLLRFDRMKKRILTMEERIKDRRIEIKHLLNLIHSSLISFTQENHSESEQGETKMIPSASKLKERGITFRVGKNDDNDATNFLDIKFENGVIKIPPTSVVDGTDLIFLNLIAFEQSYCHCRKYITAYISFMDCLINNVKDVEILCKYGIIDSWLGSEEDVSSLFNNMGKEVIIYEDDFYLSGVCNGISEFSEKPWNRRRATLMHDYFKNPWAIISFIGALLLLFFTMTQTLLASFPKFACGR